MEVSTSLRTFGTVGVRRAHGEGEHLRSFARGEDHRHREEPDDEAEDADQPVQEAALKPDALGLLGGARRALCRCADPFPGSCFGPSFASSRRLAIAVARKMLGAAGATSVGSARVVSVCSTSAEPSALVTSGELNGGSRSVTSKSGTSWLVMSGMLTSCRVMSRFMTVVPRDVEVHDVVPGVFVIASELMIELLHQLGGERSRPGWRSALCSSGSVSIGAPWLV